MATIHRFKVEGIDGKEIDFADFQGKKLIVVNVASECGFTPQYQQLQELYQQFKDKIVVIGIPTNDFGGQEPGTNREIREFCTLNYGVTFPLTNKLSVQNAPIFKWLTQKSENGVMDNEVAWNFQKYLIDEAGQLVKVYPSVVQPIDEEVLEWVSA